MTFDQILALVGLLIDFIMLVLALTCNNQTAQSQQPQAQPEPYVIKIHTSRYGRDYGGILFFACFIGICLYSKYSKEITCILTVLGIVSMIIFYLLSVKKYHSNYILLIIASITYMITFISIYFFSDPIIKPEAASFILKVLWPVYPMLGGFVICLVLVNSVYFMIFRGKPPIIKDCIINLILSLIAFFLTSGYLFHLVSLMRL